MTSALSKCGKRTSEVIQHFLSLRQTGSSLTEGLLWLQTIMVWNKIQNWWYLFVICVKYEHCFQTQSTPLPTNALLIPVEHYILILSFQSSLNRWLDNTGCTPVSVSDGGTLLPQGRSLWPFSWTSRSWIKSLRATATAQWCLWSSCTSWRRPTSQTERARSDACTTSRSPLLPSRYHTHTYTHTYAKSLHLPHIGPGLWSKNSHPSSRQEGIKASLGEASPHPEQIVLLAFKL